MNIITKTLLLSFLLIINKSYSQPERWQQKIKYNIDVTVNDVSNQLSGTEAIEYTNNSPDTLTKIFFHTYWNAFKPNSSMDVRSRELGKVSTRKDKKGNPVPDWDGRVKDRISKLSATEIGYQNVSSVEINGAMQKLVEHETILEVQLSKPVFPKSTTKIKLNFNAQVPVQIRRSGRENAEGIKYSMSQWYPKMVEYDYQGWNANPYIAREFYGVWGDFDVTINIDKKYIVAATGVISQQPTANSQQTNKKTTEQKTINNKPQAPNNGSFKTWHFVASNVHDFVWAADTGYKHISVKVRNGIVLNAYYKPSEKWGDREWNNLLYAAEKVFPFIEKKFGAYPYPQYSFIQGGDGGMEYAMATLIKGPGVGLIFHEWMHNWYQHILATNESLYPWMDEGFTTFAENELVYYYNKNLASQSPYLNLHEKDSVKASVDEVEADLPFKQADEYKAYFSLAKSGFEEPMTTHADHYNTNYAYSVASYSKGSVFLTQLGYIIGDDMRDKVLLEYYRQWKFRHPNANDFVRIAEKVSGLNLQWYKEYWVNSTKTIDYKIGNINMDSVTGKPSVTIERIGRMPMPVDVLIIYKDGSQEMHNIPLNLMFGSKPAENNMTVITEKEWQWTHPTYSFTINKKITDIKSIEIDPSQRMADINRSNNKLVVPE